MKKPTISRTSVGQKIRQIRMTAKPKVTQENMVGRLARHGVTLNQSQIAKIESGGRALVDFEILAFAKALRIPVRSLFE